MSPPSMFSIVLYLLSASMTVWCVSVKDDESIIFNAEETFKQFRDQKSETDHYRLVDGALQVFHRCDLDYQASESVAKFCSLSFVDQIDLVIKALVTIHLLPPGLGNPVKQSDPMTEADFRTKYQAWPRWYMDNWMDSTFAPKSYNCEFMDTFLVDVFSTEQSEIKEYSNLLFTFRKGFYEPFQTAIEAEVGENNTSKVEAPTWKLPRWQTVAFYVGVATVVGALIAGGIHFWPTDPTVTRTMENVSNSDQANFTSGFTGGVDGDATMSPWTIVTIVIMISLVAIFAAFVVYRLMTSTAGAGNSPSSNSFAQSKSRISDCKSSSTGSTGTVATPVSHQSKARK